MLKGNEESEQGEAGVPSLPSCAPATTWVVTFTQFARRGRAGCGALVELKQESLGWRWRVPRGFMSPFLDPASLATKQAWPVVLPPCFLLSGDLVTRLGKGFVGARPVMSK